MPTPLQEGDALLSQMKHESNEARQTDTDRQTFVNPWHIQSRGEGRRQQCNLPAMFVAFIPTSHLLHTLVPLVRSEHQSDTISY